MAVVQLKTGLTSVTFRRKTQEEIVALAAQAHLDGIEWGGDVHVPPGDLPAAKAAGRLTRQAGLEVFSYGSYFRGDPGEDPAPVVDSARALGAPLVRVWAGRAPWERCSPQERCRLAEAFRQAADLAREAGLRLAFEYHRDTATQTVQGALELLRSVGRANVGCYWQPNPDITQEERLEEIRALGNEIAHVHVFAWTEGNVRHPLSQGEKPWKEYLAALKQTGTTPRLILEFVKDDSETAFFQDAATLRRWAAGTKGEGDAT